MTHAGASEGSRRSRPSTKREDPSPDDVEGGGSSAEAPAKEEPANKIMMQAFTLTFLAEWGDRSQLQPPRSPPPDPLASPSAPASATCSAQASPWWSAAGGSHLRADGATLGRRPLLPLLPARAARHRGRLICSVSGERAARRARTQWPCGGGAQTRRRAMLLDRFVCL